MHRIALISILAGCAGKDDDSDAPTSGLPILGNGTNSLADVVVDTIGTADDGLAKPTDLAFHPDVADELWVVNQDDESVTLFSGTGTGAQESWLAKHATGEHFLALPSGMAFSDNGNWASIHDHDEPTQGGATGADFMGPTLWTGDSEIFEGGDVSHLDMLHNSPSGKGIAWAGRGNVFWVVDGEHQSLTRYDFADDHGLGGTDHTDGEVARFAEGEIAPHGRLPSHAEMDHDSGLLYVADPGNGRIALLDTSEGDKGGPVGPNYDGIELYEMEGESTSTFVDTAAEGIGTPIGIALHDGMLFVSSADPSAIHAFDLDGGLVDWLALDQEPNGITFSEAGDLYFVDAKGDEVVRIQAP